MGSSRSSFMDEKTDSGLMRVPSNGSSVYSNLNEYRKSRVVTVGANESALDDIVKFTNVQAERMLSPQGSIGDFHAERTGSSSSLSRPEPIPRTSNNSDKSMYSTYSSNSGNIAQRTSPSQPPVVPLPALPKNASSQFTAEQRGSFAQRGSFTAAPSSPKPHAHQTQRKVSPPTNFGSNNPFGSSGGFSPVDDQLSQYSFGSQSQPHTQPHQQSGQYSAQQERNSTFPSQQTNNDLPISLRPFSPPADTMGSNNSSMKASSSKLVKEPQPLQYEETIEQTGPPSAPLQLKTGEVPRKVSPTALGNFANLRNKLTTRPSQDQPAPKVEEKEKEVERPKTGSRFGKLKSKMRSSNEDENNTPVPELPAAKEEGSGWSRLKSKVKKGRSGEDDKVEKDKNGRPMLAPISTTNPADTTTTPKLGSPFKPSISPGFEAPAAPQYQAYRPGSSEQDAQQHRGDASVSTIRPFTPGESAGVAPTKIDSELVLTPNALEASQVYPHLRSESAASSTETLTKLESLKVPAPQFHPDAQTIRQRAGSAPTRGGPGGVGSGPNSSNNSPMISRNNSAYNSGANSPSGQNGYPFPVLPGQERRPQTGVVKGPKNDYPMLMPKELSSDMAAILEKSPFLKTPAIKRKALSSSVSDKPATDGAGSASGGSSGSNTLVAEDDPIYPAPAITLMQLECYQAHRHMRTSRNDVYAVACGICSIEDREKRWCCAWCSLRCCQECFKNLRSADGGLVGVVSGLGKSDIVEAIYAEKATKAREAEKIVGNLSDIPTFSFDMEKGITSGMAGAFPVTPLLV